VVTSNVAKGYMWQESVSNMVKLWSAEFQFVHMQVIPEHKNAFSRHIWCSYCKNNCGV